MVMSLKPFLNPHLNGWNIISKENDSLEITKNLRKGKCSNLTGNGGKEKQVTNTPTNMKQQCLNFEAQIGRSVLVELKDLRASKNSNNNKKL